MDTNFNAALYQEEMLSLVNTAIKKLKAEHPDYTVFTISLTTDFAFWLNLMIALMAMFIVMKQEKLEF